MDVNEEILEINNNYNEFIKSRNPSLKKTFYSLLFSLFCFYFLFDDILSAFSIIIVLLIHELGHFIMQKIYSFRGVSMSFLGPIGAAVFGVSKNNSASENFWMYIMGPLPGILISLGLFFLYENLNLESDFIIYLMIMMFYINIFNLLPVSFLDGGRIFEICFNKYLKIRSILSVLFYLPLLYLYYSWLTESFHDGRFVWFIVLLIPFLIFCLHFLHQLFFRKRINFLIKESEKLSYFLIDKKGYIPNEIDHDTVIYIEKNINESDERLISNECSIEDIWSRRESPLTNTLRIKYIIIYLSLLFISLFIYVSVLLEPQNGYGSHNYIFIGCKYEGEWKDGTQHGTGTYTWDNGEKYEGEWKNGERTGHGTYTYDNGDKYVGEFKDGQRTGYGTYTYPNGTKYVGKFKDGKHHGQGTYTYADGTVYKGLWENGKFIGEK